MQIQQLTALQQQKEDNQLVDRIDKHLDNFSPSNYRNAANWQSGAMTQNLLELTSLLNRKEFQHQLDNALTKAKNRKSQHALLYIDVDQFSLTNNLLGHVTSDAVPTHVSGKTTETSPSTSDLIDNDYIVLREQPIQKFATLTRHRITKYSLACAI